MVLISPECFEKKSTWIVRHVESLEEKLKQLESRLQIIACLGKMASGMILFLQSLQDHSQ